MSAGQLISRLLLLSVLATAGSGCASWRDRMTESYHTSRTEREWWAANKHRAVFVPDRGYYIEGIGFFDANGRPINEEPDAAQVVRSTPQHEDEYEGWLFNRLMGREQPASTASAPVPLPSPTQETIPTPSPTPAKKDDGPSGWDALTPSGMSKNWKRVTGQSPDDRLAHQYFNEGEGLFRQAKYKESAAKYKKAAKRGADSPLEEDAMFMQAESYFFAEQYSKACDTYGELLKRYINSRHLEKVVSRQFAIAEYWQKMHEANPHWPITPNLFDRTLPLFDTSGNALAAFDSVRLKDPTGPLADDAIMATGTAYFVKGRYEDADYYFNLLRRDYPRSEHLILAFELGVQSKLRKYQGPEYVGKPLEEAAELIDQMLVQFPTELADKRERLLTARKEVRAQLALRDWEMAEFYAKGEHYGAARYYYAQIIKEYPQSNFAQLAQSKLDTYKNEPDQAPDRFEWVADVIPGDENRSTRR